MTDSEEGGLQPDCSARLGNSVRTRCEIGTFADTLGRLEAIGLLVGNGLGLSMVGRGLKLSLRLVRSEADLSWRTAQGGKHHPLWLLQAKRWDCCRLVLVGICVVGEKS